MSDYCCLWQHVFNPFNTTKYSVWAYVYATSPCEVLPGTRMTALVSLPIVQLIFSLMIAAPSGVSKGFA